MNNLQIFQNYSFIKALRQFFEDLKIPVSYIDDKAARPKDVLGEYYNTKKDGIELMEEVYALGVVDAAAFTNTKSNITTTAQAANMQQDYDGLLLFGVTLKHRKDGLLPTRTQLAEITRAFNRVFLHFPVTVIFQYHDYIALANAERQSYKRESKEGEKIGKVNLLKDIYIPKPHRGHQDILAELAINKPGTKPVNTFAQLYIQWQKVLSAQTLNKRFYQELFHWYLWAKRHIEIPAKPVNETQDKDTLTAIFTIRLLTRILFVWFVKEKKLIPNNAFDIDYISTILKGFDPDGTLAAMGKKSEGNYYKAILQNLFFATLNTPMDNDAATDERRQFLDKSTGKTYNDNYLDQTKYRYNDLLKEPEVLLQLFKNVPFLNGGLFECLDYREEDATERRYDGFSSKKAKQAIVPDVLFFSPQNEEDLSADFDGDSKMKRVRIRGLISILDSYKFTIAENTPLEEEVALDPELLGKVFENLLASYNPETKTTARKQTGSFYTPREIVSYMVDESLKAYLLQKLMNKPEAFVEAGKVQPDMWGNAHRKGQLKIETSITNNNDPQKEQQYERALQQLFNDAHPHNVFTAADCNLLIEAISNCRILDPACGSGAFPMGILHRMVSLLARLDPNNKAWKQTQLNKAQSDLKSAQNMQDEMIKESAVQSAEQRIIYIKESFDNPRHELDFTRKLFLIQDCIYGVDIQQIAVQIAKLRFFISLMSEQQVDDSKPNRNIISMPNLETKFVAANTLIALEKNVSSKKGMVGSMEIRSDEVIRVEKDLKELRKQIFFTRSYRQKKRLKKNEKALREALKTAFEKSGFIERSAEQAAQWDPFDQLHSAPFFDTETMFGFTEGFDVVIGNPPYVQLQKMPVDVKQILEKQQYKTYAPTGDIYQLFYEKGIGLNKSSGHLCYITSNKWMRTDYGEVTRKYFGEGLRTKALIDFGMAQMFESATTYTNILLIAKEKGNPFIPMCRVKNDYAVTTPLQDYVEKNSIQVDHPGTKSWIAYDKTEYNLIKRIEAQGVPLKDWDIRINRGILTGFNEAFIIDTQTRNRLVEEDPKSNEIIKPILRGEDIKAYVPQWAGKWIIGTFPALNININHYPAIKKYLSSFRTQIEPKPKGFSGKWEGRKSGSYEWFETQDSISYYEDFLKPKIIYPNITKYLPFVYDKGSFFTNDLCFIITGEKLHYLTAFLNSKLFRFTFKEHFPELLGDSRKMNKIFFETIAVKTEQNEKWYSTQIAKIQEYKLRSKPTVQLQTEIDEKLFDHYQLSQGEKQLILVKEN